MPEGAISEVPGAGDRILTHLDSLGLSGHGGLGAHVCAGGMGDGGRTAKVWWKGGKIKQRGTQRATFSGLYLSQAPVG